MKFITLSLPSFVSGSVNSRHLPFHFRLHSCEVGLFQVNEMSYLQVTSVRPSLRVPNQYNTLCGSDIHCIAPVNIYNLHRALKSTLGSSKKCMELMNSLVIQRTCVSPYQHCTPICSFGGKGESKNSNEGSPWKSIEKTMSSFKKEPSLEDVLRQQMEKQDYYDGGSGGDSPGGGGGSDGAGGGFGGTEDEGFAGMFDEILQVTLSIIALIVLYLNIIAGDQVMLFIRDTFDFLAGKKGPRLRTIMYKFAEFYQKFRAKVPYDPYWLEKEIILTPTWWDSPTKYRRMLKVSTRADKSSKHKIDSDSDEKSYTDNTHSDNAYDEDSDDDNAYGKKTYNDEDDDDDNAYNQDVDDD